jgi:TolB-like protein
LTVPFLNAIETALVSSGARVFSAAPSDAVTEPMYMVESTVQRSGDRGRVNVRLVDPDPSATVWAQQLDFALDSAFVAQDEIARRVSEAVTQARLRRGG